MAKIRALASLLILGLAAPSRALPLWRDKVASRWTTAAAPLDGKGPEWDGARELEEPGLSFRALNDGKDVYLLLTSVNRDGRALLTGAFRQDFTIWFLGADRKTRVWGLRLPYSDIEAPPGVSWEDVKHPDEGAPAQSSWPVWVSAGLLVSTAALPDDIQYKADMAGREPAHGFRIPLTKMPLRKSRSIPVEFASSRASPEVERQFAQRRANEPPPSAWQRPPREDGKTKKWITVTGTTTEGVYPDGSLPPAMSRRRENAEPRLPKELLLPEPLDVRFSLQLASDPARSPHHE